MKCLAQMGPAGIPIWYRCWGGFVYSGRLYEVKYQVQQVAKTVRDGGQLGEITMPYTRSFVFSKYKGLFQITYFLLPLFALDYRHHHWT